MATSALVITWDGDPAARRTTLAELDGDPRATVGDSFGRRQAVVVETINLREGRAIFEQIRDMPGVAHLELACVYFEDPALDLESWAEAS